jgi:hypothetical protein
MTPALRARVAAILVAAAAGVTLVAAGAFMWSSARHAVQSASGLMLPDVERRLGEVEAIRVDLRGESYTLARAPDGWAMPERGNHPVDEEALQRLALGLARLERLEVRDGGPAALEAVGLGDPRQGGSGALVTLRGAGGATIASVIVGARPSGTYARLPDAASGFRVTDDLMPPFQDPARWLALPAFSLRTADIAAVSSGDRLALTRWRPLDVKPAAALSGPVVARQVATLAAGGTATVTVFDEGGSPFATLEIDSPDPALAGAGAAARGWAYALAPVDAQGFGGG